MVRTAILDAERRWEALELKAARIRLPRSVIGSPWEPRSDESVLRLYKAYVRLRDSAEANLSELKEQRKHLFDVLRGTRVTPKEMERLNRMKRQMDEAIAQRERGLAYLESQVKKYKTDLDQRGMPARNTQARSKLPNRSPRIAESVSSDNIKNANAELADFSLPSGAPWTERRFRDYIARLEYESREVGRQVQEATDAVTFGTDSVLFLSKALREARNERVANTNAWRQAQRDRINTNPYKKADPEIVGRIAMFARDLKTARKKLAAAKRRLKRAIRKKGEADSKLKRARRVRDEMRRRGKLESGTRATLDAFHPLVASDLTNEQSNRLEMSINDFESFQVDASLRDRWRKFRGGVQKRRHRRKAKKEGKKARRTEEEPLRQQEEQLRRKDKELLAQDRRIRRQRKKVRREMKRLRKQRKRVRKQKISVAPLPSSASCSPSSAVGSSTAHGRALIHDIGNVNGTSLLNPVPMQTEKQLRAAHATSLVQSMVSAADALGHPHLAGKSPLAAEPFLKQARKSLKYLLKPLMTSAAASTIPTGDHWFSDYYYGEAYGGSGRDDIDWLDDTDQDPRYYKWGPDGIRDRIEDWMTAWLGAVWPTSGATAEPLLLELNPDRSALRRAYDYAGKRLGKHWLCSAMPIADPEPEIEKCWDQMHAAFRALHGLVTSRHRIETHLWHRSANTGPGVESNPTPIRIGPSGVWMPLAPRSIAKPAQARREIAEKMHAAQSACAEATLRFVESMAQLYGW